MLAGQRPSSVRLCGPKRSEQCSAPLPLCRCADSQIVNSGTVIPPDCVVDVEETAFNLDLSSPVRLF